MLPTDKRFVAVLIALLVADLVWFFVVATIGT